MYNILEKYNTISEKVKEAALKCGRNPNDIKIIAVSKTKPIEMVKEAVDGGIMDFGENKPQEIVLKYPGFCENNIRWHMIGNLQKNKVKHIIDKVCLIHSVDSVSLAEEIQKRASVINKVQDILLQVNVSGEETKSGFSENELFDACKEIARLKNVRIKGLMTISVRDYSYEQNRDLFLKLAELKDRINDLKINGVALKELSMGMTHDFEAAVEAGSTMIRVGTAIFGERDYSNNAV